MSEHGVLTRVAALLGAACVAMAGVAAAAGLAESGRKVSADHGRAVVTVELVLKQQMTMFGKSSHEEESKSEVIGTMIDPGGLTVISLTSMDPSRIVMDSVAGSMGMGGMNFDMASEIASAKIVLDDGTELDARVVLRDPDMDLAFVRPAEKPGEPLAHVDLSDAAEPEVLDDLITLNRLGKLGRRTSSVSLGLVEAVVTKPRRFYVPTQSLSALLSLGCPVFTRGGKVVGLSVVRSGKTEGASIKDLVMAIVVPASDIIEGAEQASAVGKAVTDEAETDKGQ